MSTPKNWTTVAESQFPWERDALAFVRERFPTHEPYRAWSNFEFVADDGSVNEVDLLVFTPHGFFLIEIKSHPGRLTGDAGTWTFQHDGQLRTLDNPLIAANLKARKLSSLLQRQRAFRKKDARLPFIEALVFCSAPGLHIELAGNAAHRVCLRDSDDSSSGANRPGIMAAIRSRKCPGLEHSSRGQHDRPMAKLVSQALEQAGIRQSQRHRKVRDWTLDHILAEGPGYQDWEAKHASVGTTRRIRIYLVHQEATDEDRRTIERAARREFQLLEALDHPGVLRCLDYTEHELGPALFFEHDPEMVRLDHYLAQNQDQLNFDARLGLIRKIAEVIRFAHDRKVVHRGLCPSSILVKPGTDSGQPQVKVFNWQVGYRSGGTTSPSAPRVTATAHVDRLVEDAGTAYMAPEALSESDNTGEHLDVFSLGAIAYHIFADQPPAANGVELNHQLRMTRGLQISAVLNGAGTNLQDLIQYSTHPEVPSRIDSVHDFLEFLDSVEEELTDPEHDVVENPAAAQKGDRLPGGYTVSQRFGPGSCAVALLVERDGEQYVMKAASSPEQNGWLRDEAEVLAKLRHQHIVEYCDMLEIGDRACILMRRAGTESLGQRLRKEGRLHVDLLHRFGEDLLSAVAYLEEQGIPHRDIKPDNIGIGPIGRGDKLHLVLFDFSLSRMPADNIRAGTTGYLDPLLPLRKPPRWDLHAERYAAAATLYELAAGQGNLPVWGDGETEPSQLDCEATVDADLFDAGVRDGLAPFFHKAFRRDPAERFDNAEEMLRAWRQCFEGLEPATTTGDQDSRQLQQRLAEATFDTQIAELGLGPAAANALDRANVITVRDLLAMPLRRLNRLRGVGHQTRRDIAGIGKQLRDRLGQPPRSEPTATPTTEHEEEVAAADGEEASVDMLAPLVVKPLTRSAARNEPEIIAGLLGLARDIDMIWPGQSDVARALDLTPVAVHQALKKAQPRWRRQPPITALRDDLVEIIRAHGGVCAVEELRDAVLVARGSIEDEPERSRLAMAVVRAAVEVERTIQEPRLIVRRDRARVLVALDQDLANYASRLGNAADRLADEDPLAAPARIIDQLRTVQPREFGEPMSDTRLVRLAAAASQHAALSSRQELYPRGMDAGRAIKLSQGALLGVRYLQPQQVHERVLSRYPEAEPPPDRPELDKLLEAAGLELVWKPDACDGEGAYVSSFHDAISVTTGSQPVSRYDTFAAVGDTQITPEIADAREFEERLQRADHEGAFLALLVNPNHYQRASDEIQRRFDIELIDFEGLLLDALRAEAERARVKWELVLQTDATPNEGDWNKLLLLIQRAMPCIEQQMRVTDRTMLMIYPAMFARYDQMDLLQRMRDQVGRRDGIHGLWILIPNDTHAMMDGRAIPIIGPGQRIRVPEAWIKNVHRANGHIAVS